MKKILILSLLAISAILYASEKPEKELCFQLLDIEREAGFEVHDSLYTFLEDILNAAEDSIETKENYTREDALEVLGRIAVFIKKYINYDKPEFGNLSISEAITQNRANCVTLSIFNYLIGKRLHLPICYSRLQDHSNIIFIANGDTLYWETTANIQLTIDEYCEWLNIKRSSIKGARYLIPLVDSSIISDLYSVLGNSYFHKKSFDRAVDLYHHSIKYDSANPMAYDNIGVAYHEIGDYDNSLKYYFKGLQIAPHYASLISNIGVYYLNKNKLDSALYYTEKAISLDSLLPGSYRNIGSYYFKLNKYDNAISNYKKSILIDSTMPQTYFQLALTYQKSEKYKEAIENYTKAIDLDSTYKMAFQNRGTAECQSGNFKKGISDLTKAIELDSNYSKGYINRGYAYKQIGEIEKACKDFKKAASLGNVAATNLYEECKE